MALENVLKSPPVLPSSLNLLGHRAPQTTLTSRPYYVYTMYSILYKFPHPDDFNYVFDVIIRPFAFICAIVPILCYVAIFGMYYRANKSTVILDNELAAKRKREVWRSLQFAFVFVFYVLLWISFELQPVLPREHPSVFSFEIFVAICDCITTALIQAVMNQRVIGYPECQQLTAQCSDPTNAHWNAEDGGARSNREVDCDGRAYWVWRPHFHYSLPSITLSVPDANTVLGTQSLSIEK